MRRDKEAQVRGACETVESHLWSSDSRSAYRGIRTLRSSRLPPRCSTVKAADGTTLTGESEIRARWAGYFEELYHVDPPTVSFQGMLTLSGMRTVDRILALRVLTERLRDFRIGLLTAYVDLRKAFDSVNRDVLWRILALRGIPPKLVNLISGLYSFSVQSNFHITDLSRLRTSSKFRIETGWINMF